MSVKLICMSDIHGCFYELALNPLNWPAFDVLIIAGDVSNVGCRNKAELAAVRDWLREVVKVALRPYPARRGFIIPGNHDIGINQWNIDGLNDLAYREAVSHGLRFYGVPLTACYDMPELAKSWDHMTTNPKAEAAAFDMPPVDVVVSHGPPLGIRDTAYDGRSIGSEQLARYIQRHSPKLVVCGHVHEAHGQETMYDTTVLNVAGRVRLIEL